MYVYKITNTINNKVYIGITQSIEKRRIQHLTVKRNIRYIMLLRSMVKITLHLKSLIHQMIENLYASWKSIILNYIILMIEIMVIIYFWWRR